MDLVIKPKLLSGHITPPPSKSQAHRAIIASMIAGGGEILNVSSSEDMKATINCMNILKNCKKGDMPKLFCGESGSTLRFLIPVALALCEGAVFSGAGRLMSRPQQPYFDIFDEIGIQYEYSDECLSVKGKLVPGEYKLLGNVSSQFITGLLFALPLIDGNSSIKLISNLESKAYVDMTIDVLEKFSIKIEQEESSYKIKGNQEYIAYDMSVESDFSQAAFWFTANALGSKIKIEGLSENSLQGDKCIIDYTKKLSSEEDVVELDVSQCPDLVPTLSAHAALRDGKETRIINAARLKIKESDRLNTVALELNKLGANVEEYDDKLIIKGVKNLKSAKVYAHNDHRIAMMLAIAATRAFGDVTIEMAECVKKSYPNFWEHYKSLGGIVCE